RFGIRKSSRLQIRETLLLRKSQRIVDLASDSGFFQMRHHAIAPVLESDDVLIENVAVPRQLPRQDDSIVSREQFVVNLRIAPPPFSPLLEVAKLHVKDRGLQR